MNELEVLLKANIEQNEKNNIQEIELRIPRDVYFDKFYGCFSNVQEELKVLCSRYGLEMYAQNKDQNICFEDQGLIRKEDQPVAIIIKLRRDYDSPVYINKLKELSNGSIRIR